MILKTEGTAAGSSALHHRNELNFKMHSDREPLSYIIIIFHSICIFTAFLIN